MDDMFYEVRNVLSGVFGVPSEWFAGPQFVTNLIVPYVLLAGCFYVLLSKKIRIFRRGGIVNWVLAALLAFFAIPFAIAPFPYASVFTGVMVIVLFSGYKITGRRLLLAVVAAVAAFVLDTWAAAFLASVFTF